MGLFWDPDKKSRRQSATFERNSAPCCCQQQEITHWKAASEEELEVVCPRCGAPMVWQVEITSSGSRGETKEWVGRCMSAFVRK